MIYFLVLAGTALGLWTELSYSRPRIATGDPTTAAHIRRYTIVLSTLGFIAWVAANLVGNQAIRSFNEEAEAV